MITLYHYYHPHVDAIMQITTSNEQLYPNSYTLRSYLTWCANADLPPEHEDSHSLSYYWSNHNNNKTSDDYDEEDVAQDLK